MAKEYVVANVTSEESTSNTFVEVLRRQAAAHPNRVAYTFLSESEAEGKDITFAELEKTALMIAAFLSSSISPGERVLLLLPSGLDYVASFFGCLYAGVIAVPGFPPHAGRGRHGEPWFQTIVRDAKPRLVFSTPEMIHAVPGKWMQEVGISVVSPAEIDRASGAEWHPPKIDAATIAFLQYTSGSTSQPRGVMVSHQNLLHNMKVIQEACGNDEESTVVSWLPLHHDMGLIGTVLHPAYLGARSVLMSPATFLHNPVTWLKAITRFHGKSSSAPNFAYDLCARRIKREQKVDLDLSSWRIAVNGAEPVRSDTMDRFTAAFSECGFNREAFRPSYGLAEATLMVTGARTSQSPLTKLFSIEALERNRVREPVSESDARVLVGCGHALPGHQVCLVDPKTRKLCVENEIGEIWIDGPSVAQGYWNRLEESESTFRAGLFPEEQGPFLRTGDLGFLYEGQLFITGRCKNLIIVHGRNLYPQDLEQTALQADSSLRPDAGAAFVVESGVEERVVLLCEIDRHAKSGPEKVIAAIREAILLEYGISVHTVALLRHGTIPRTTSGKVRHSTARELFLAGALAVVAQSTLEHDASGTASMAQLSLDQILQAEPELRYELIQNELRDRAAEVLKINPEGIRCDQPLVSLGLDSLMAAELKAWVEASFGKSLDTLELLEGASVAVLAAKILDQLDAENKPKSSQLEIPDSGSFPLSYGQKGLWVLHRIAPNSSAYTLVSAARTRSSLDIAALRAAFLELMARQPMLRTIFTNPEGNVCQTILTPGDIQPERHFEYRDLSALPTLDLSNLLNEELQNPFSLDREPPIRFLLLTLNASEHVAMLMLHHIIADLVSLENIFYEFEQLYERHRDGAKSILRKQGASFIEFVRWQAAMVESSEGVRQSEYWRTTLAGELPILEIPGARPRLTEPTFRGASLLFKLDQGLIHHLEMVARQTHATVFMVVAAIFQVLLHRVTGQQDLLLGTPASGRSRTEFASTIGYCVNPVVLRSQYNPSSLFVRYLAEVRRGALDAFANQDFPFSLLVEKLHPSRESGISPIFQAMFVWQGVRSGWGEALAAMSMGAPQVRFKLADLELDSIALENTGSQFDITLMMAPTMGGFSGTFKYNSNLFDEVHIKGLARQFSVLLEEVVNHSDRTLDAYSLLSRHEREQLLAASGAGADSIGLFAGSVLEVFAEQVTKTPLATALIAGTERITYEQLNARSNQFARYLQKLGVGPEVRVGLCLNRSVEMVLALLGVWKAGGAYVPFNPQDPGDRLAALIEQSGIKVIVAHEELIRQIPARLPQLVLLNLDLDLIAIEEDSNLNVPIERNNLAYAIFTSGSTGHPKGVMIEHRSLMNLLSGLQHAIYSDYPSQLRVSLNAPLAFDSSVKQLLALVLGHTLCIVPEEVRRNGEALLALVEEFGLQVLDCTPTQAQMIIEGGLLEKNPHLTLLLGGEAVPAESWEVLSNRYSGRSYNLYGPTECTVDATCCRLNLCAAPSIGRPLPGTNVYILNSSMELVPAGMFGEICIGGFNVGRGYLDNPRLTAERFLPDPFAGIQDARMYRSGDQGRFLDDGTIEFMGRLDRQVKVRGFRIELGEIEAALGQHPGVLDAAVVLQKSAAGDRRLIGYVVANEELSSNAYRDFLVRRLPEYMVPAAVVRIPRMPISANGKRNYALLPTAEISLLDRGSDYVPPQSNLEKYLVSLWSRTLNVEPVGIHDNFFSLGGDSLQATRLITQVQQDYPTGLPLLALFFQEPTIAALSLHVATTRVEK